MDKPTERETHDFMNVDSFSQLPFIRPTPPIKEKNGIRLFGIEFASGNDAVTDDSESAETTTNNNNINAFDIDATNKDTTTTNNHTTETNGESSRRFECHYCCRNFPTSQALGGHQNAHKRERQHAKRAHLQSTMVHGSTFSDAHHVYNLMNYRFSSTTPTTPMPYPTWNSTSTNTNTNRFYGTTSFSHNHHNHHHHQQQQQQQPINGSPLAFWRIPSGTSNPSSFNHERSLPPLFGGEEINNVRASQVVVGASGSQNRYVYDSKRGSVHDHVSLDLHL